ncbi:unnamed protein product [Acanthoscelides obtectus]|uniref:Cilia- and flagella-associated protein 53 n=1 Tax=Acanthoscelides obtectus TaxID=200917 RepID=A0A9P0LJ87_ACAOB|nr:unnamed protein product [Acanthoscelides obtectus]CAK1657366.1 Cilia- and flagella-associated protein 53 [Acanthoscelides obtectus]
MFGGEVPIPKAVRKPRLPPNRQDILCPGLPPGSYGHIAREPNTDYDVKWRQYRQRKAEFNNRRDSQWVTQALQDRITFKYDSHASKRQLQRQIKEKVQEKMQAFEQTVEKRREKLRDLLAQEERQYVYEVIDMAQKGDALRMEEMKKRSEFLKKQKEEERLKIVHEKRIQQYRDRCVELRPALIKKHLIESKNTQLQQMRENEAKRQAERELDRMWHELMQKDVRAKMDREQQELLAEKDKNRDLVEVWNKQMRGRQLHKQEINRIALEDKMEMERMSEKMRREEIEALDENARKRAKIAKELLEQISSQEEYARKRKEEEEAFNRAFTKLAELEYQRERDRIKNESAQAAQEVQMYRKHLQELEVERKKEERQLEELLEIHKKEIERKQNEAKCKLAEAKAALQKSVLEGRAQQIADKKRAAEGQFKMKQAENELLKMVFDQNERLQAECDRLHAEAVRQYRDDLAKQIEHNGMLRRKEQEELDRQLTRGRQEEEMYQKIVADMINMDIPEGSCPHPFRRVLDQYDCHCLPKE